MLHDFFENFKHNLFKPLLLFFYMGFSIPILGVPFEFPHVIYQGLTMYLLIAIGWHGGEELASLDAAGVQQALGFMVIGFILNFIIGCVAYFILRKGTRLRNIDAATVAGYYGSDSAGTFVTCLGVLGAAQIAYAAYMPVMLAIMEIPGCLVALYLVSRLRHHGLDAAGNMPYEPGYDPDSVAESSLDSGHGHGSHGNGHGGTQGSSAGGSGGAKVAVRAPQAAAVSRATEEEEKSTRFAAFINWELLHEVFLNPGLYLLFGGIVIGYISRLQGEKVTKDDDFMFVTLFQGVLCLFLLEMGMTACKRLRDLKSAGIPFIAFALIAPNIFAA
ncbi:MAG TPA: sodium-dependent bicarbonate transport family permease, partial [Pirellulales bacterium]|nr:sodium-dependent bicarbonate transport family permease [Pirellulales bacterium]